MLQLCLYPLKPTWNILFKVITKLRWIVINTWVWVDTHGSLQLCCSFDWEEGWGRPSSSSFGSTRGIHLLLVLSIFIVDDFDESKDNMCACIDNERGEMHGCLDLRVWVNDEATHLANLSLFSGVILVVIVFLVVFVSFHMIIPRWEGIELEENSLPTWANGYWMRKKTARQLINLFSLITLVIACLAGSAITC